ncbi:hypothetical protein ANCDUO_17257 [Ancylostoma duodenale]|uniref:Uncharacterized protein n=1 Tax=Ancylostoma duodenale TaxID=51022 RepID=A0A0C2C8G4_9BILA|nr:hypothetical protein ANCDUO_17257 [Ancylostoma duodenale]
MAFHTLPIIVNVRHKGTRPERRNFDDGAIAKRLVNLVVAGMWILVSGNGIAAEAGIHKLIRSSAGDATPPPPFVHNNSYVEEVRRQLERIRDPLFQHLPVSYLTRLEDGEDKSRKKHSPDGG